MRKLLNILLFCTTASFAQNYQYAQNKKPELQKAASIVEAPLSRVIDLNQIEEKAYFAAHFLPLSEKANIQKALDQYGAIRLDKGSYEGVAITMHSNQHIYGHPTFSWTSKITVAGGSSNVSLINMHVEGEDLHLGNGAPITNCLFKNFAFTGIVADSGAMIENCEFINFIISYTNLDFSKSGYYRNNKFIKIQGGGAEPRGTAGITIKGNSSTPSYGNTHLWTNLLTPQGDAIVLDNLQSSNWVGVDTEMWNSEGLSVGNKSMFYATNMGVLNITELGGTDYSKTPTGGYNIDAKKLLLLNNGIGSSVLSKISTTTNAFNLGSYIDITRQEGTVGGYDLSGQRLQDIYNTSDVYINGLIQSTVLSNTGTMVTDYLGTKKTPWSRPSWENLPDPLGANWKIDRVGKPDSASYIQNLINTNKIAELPEGVFYIGSSLNVGSNGEGIIGAGTGKTIICGLTDDFPLISMYNKKSPGADYFGTDYTLAYLTLQGGSKGQFFPENYWGTSYITPKFVIFRDQAIGAHFYKMGGTDNCFWDHVSFINCGIGFYQDSKYFTGDPGYIDKVVFYDNQFLNCGIGVSVQAARADNLNAWVNCKFDNNEIAYENGSNNFPIMANCDFTNTYGDYIIRGGDISLYNCDFHDNKPTIATHHFVQIWAEGCNFMDNVPFSTSVINNSTSQTILNSTIVGDAIDRKHTGNKLDRSLFMNTNLLFHPTINKFMMTVKGVVPTVIIDAAPNPYPQLLVTQ
ncbi:hypothetical protein FFWV33_12035 [Flavobacterium faecale]|uniref:Uncharacterized protein n=1 Tax=Flavobacterium faecale TaxID=1355330 RepID=A0A2S1LEI4_9FLAO|nr:hypothetical protein [Flavobacterium faecale]AWG22190.1 hypothetical protein FFWV33_12035 [Flavobacterium faecale]